VPRVSDLAYELMRSAYHQATYLTRLAGESKDQEVPPFDSTRQFARRSRAKANLKVVLFIRTADAIGNRSNPCVHITKADDLRGMRTNAAALPLALRDIDSRSGVY
jgi:hypothetical protein